MLDSGWTQEGDCQNCGEHSDYLDHRGYCTKCSLENQGTGEVPDVGPVPVNMGLEKAIGDLVKDGSLKMEPIPDVELISAREYVDDLFKNKRCDEPNLLRIPKSGLVAIIEDREKYARAYGEQKQREVDARKCEEQKKFTNSRHARNSLEKAAEAIKEGK